MATRPDIATNSAASFLRLLGYSVTQIPTSNKRTCDLRADHPSGNLWIEAKLDEVSHDAKPSLRRGERVELEEAVAVSRKVENTLRSAEEQLRESAPVDSWKLVWFLVTPPGDIARASSIHCTLHGVRWFAIKAGERLSIENVVPVFLAGKAAFQRYRGIAGAVVQSMGHTTLYMNPFNPRWAEFRQTLIHSMLVRAGGAFELEVAARNHPLYVISMEAAGQGQDRVISDLQERYGVIAEPIADPSLFASRSVVWPGNEMGGIPLVPGSNIGPSEFDLACMLNRGHRG